MTTVDEARAALLWADAEEEIDALIVAVRAEAAREAGPGHAFAFETGVEAAYERGRAESAEQLRALREAVELYVAAHENAALSDTERAWLAEFRAALDATTEAEWGPGCAICGTHEGTSEADRHAWLHP